MDVFYLHGFASSPASTKAAFFAERLAAHGIGLRTPDFNAPDFRTLTMSRMIDRVAADVAGAASGPVTLIGSSLGGAVAVLVAAAHPTRIGRLVLLAPAVMIGRPGHHLLPSDRVDDWRRAGARSFYHYAFGEERLLDFAFYEDSIRHDPFAAPCTQPALIFQGRHDTVVAPDAVAGFAARAPQRRLVLLDDDHQLGSSLPRIWEETEGFLELSQKPR